MCSSDYYEAMRNFLNLLMVELESHFFFTRESQIQKDFNAFLAWSK